jgi:hypothetical protein
MHRFFFVSINCCLLEPIAIYFSIEVKRVFKENIMFLLFFSKLLQIMIFFSKQIYLWGPYSIGKKPFHPMIRLFFIFLNKLVFGALFHWKKLFQIMIGLFFFFFLLLLQNKPVFGGLRRPPNSLYGWADPAQTVYNVS